MEILDRKQECVDNGGVGSKTILPQLDNKNIADHAFYFSKCDTWVRRLFLKPRCYENRSIERQIFHLILLHSTIILPGHVSPAIACPCLVILNIARRYFHFSFHGDALSQPIYAVLPWKKRVWSVDPVNTTIFS